MEKNTVALAKEEINAWLADTLQRQADVIITSDVRQLADICQDPDRDEVTVVAWTDFDEMSVAEFFDYRTTQLVGTRGMGRRPSP